MSEQVVVDEVDLFNVYSDMENPQSRGRMRRVLRDAETVQSAGGTDEEQARAEGCASGTLTDAEPPAAFREGFAAGMFMVTLADTFEE